MFIVYNSEQTGGKMKVTGKQKNSRMCIMCGLDNEYGVRAPFYNMEDGSVMTKFMYREQHQSYPGRVHGGLITAMIDELGLRALWAKERAEDSFGVTFSIDTKYRRPVPYDVPLIGRGLIVKDTSRFFVTEACIMDSCGTVLANGTVKYIRLSVGQIAGDVSAHEELCYLNEDGIKDISFK